MFNVIQGTMTQEKTRISITEFIFKALQEAHGP